MNKILIAAVLISLLVITGCGLPSKVEVGMTLNQANDVMKVNKLEELELKSVSWDESSWRVYVMPNNTCVEFFCDDAKSEVITSITVGEKGQGYWAEKENPNNEIVEKIYVSDFEKEE